MHDDVHGVSGQRASTGVEEHGCTPSGVGRLERDIPADVVLENLQNAG